MDLERNVKRTQPDFYAAIEVDSVRVMTLPYGQSALVVPQNCKINLGQMKEDDKCNTSSSSSSSSSHYKLIIHASVDRAPHKSQFEPLPLLLYKPLTPTLLFLIAFLSFSSGVRTTSNSLWILLPQPSPPSIRTSFRPISSPVSTVPLSPPLVPPPHSYMRSPL